jgi:glycosyltransferase involved in cell wall biosynthesis
MKISVLLPTRDRLPLLRRAVESVLRQDDENWELVISDNDSADDVEGYAASLDSSRIVYVRTPRLLPVTENWNNALKHSSGDYVIMLGDDDALLSCYFDRTRQLIADFARPQVIYHNALVYAYPGVIPDQPAGYLRSEGYADFLQGAKRPFILDRRRAESVVRAAMDMRLRYGFNMQFVTLNREIIEELSNNGPFFRSPFPDYYAMNHLFMRARSIVVDPRPQVVIGVSPSSYGFFHNNTREAEGRSFLEGNAERARPERGAAAPLLPGTNINDGWLRAMEELHSELGSPASMRPNYRRYRKLQITYGYEGRFLRGTASVDDLAATRRHLRPIERVLYDAAFSALSLIVRVAPASMSAHIRNAIALAARQFPAWDPGHDPAHYRDILDVVERVEPASYPSRWKPPRGSRLRRVLPRRS